MHLGDIIILDMLDPAFQSPSEGDAPVVPAGGLLAPAIAQNISITSNSLRNVRYSDTYLTEHILSTVSEGFTPEIRFFSQFPATSRVKYFELLIDHHGPFGDLRPSRPGTRHIVDLQRLNRIGIALPSLSILAFGWLNLKTTWRDIHGRPLLSNVQAWEGMQVELQRAASIALRSEVRRARRAQLHSFGHRFSVSFEPVPRESL